MRGVVGFYSAKEAQEKLNINHDQFQYWVKKGVIHKVILPGRIYGLYPQAEVNQLAEAIEALIKQYNQSASAGTPDANLGDHARMGA